MISLFHAYPIIHFWTHWNGVSQAYQQAVEKVPKVLSTFSKQEHTMGDELLNARYNCSPS